jgi:hypothetical protein
MNRPRLLLASSLLLAPLALAVPASASPASVFCSVLKTEPAPPVNDLSPSIANVHYYTALSHWATHSASVATTSKLHTVFSNLAVDAASVSSYLLKAHNKPGFSNTIIRSFYITHAGISNTKANIELRAAYSATHAFCP